MNRPGGSGPMVECENLVKIYKTRDVEVLALQGLDLTVERGEFLAIIGNSGSGKSTFLNLLGGLDTPSAGRLAVDGHDLLAMDGDSRVLYKRRTVGFVWQNSARNLVPYLTAQQNVELPILLDGGRNRRERALELLERVGLSHRRRSRLQELSGGEQQRVAIAIALANCPGLLLADEPTGSVDRATAGRIFDLFRSLNQESGLTVLIVTHDRQIARRVGRVVAIRDGRTSSEFRMTRQAAEELARMGAAGLSSWDWPGSGEPSHEELVVLDRNGRLQLPRDYLDRLGLHGRSRMRADLEEGRIVLRPEGEGAVPADPDEGSTH